MAEDLLLWGESARGLERWSTTAADGSGVASALEGDGLRFDFRLGGEGSWAIARCAVDAVLPPHFVLVLRLRGEASPHELQVKLVDPSGANVWWWRRPAFEPTRDGETLVLRRAALEFAWGPRSGGDPERIGAVEIGWAANTAASGYMLVEELRVEARPLRAAEPRVTAIRASSCIDGGEPGHALDVDAGTFWSPDPWDPQPWIELDLGDSCEWGGVVVDFDASADSPATRLLGSDDGRTWSVLAEDPGGPGPRRWLRTSEGEGRFARLAFPAGEPTRVVRLDVVPLALAVAPARHVAARARRAPRGLYPRHLLGEQAYWAVVGADGDEEKGLLGEDGALEIAASSFSLEPFLWDGERLLTWADVSARQGLEDGFLPVPSVEWEAGGIGLRVTAFASGPAGRSTLVLRCEVRRPNASCRDLRFLLALRPFQVNPSWQALNLVGGVAPIFRIERDGPVLRVNGSREVHAVTPPDAFGAARSAEGLEGLPTGRLPELPGVEDPLGFAEGVLSWSLDPGPDEACVVTVAVPLHPESARPPADLDARAAAAWAEERLQETRAFWRARLDGIPIRLPESAAPFAASLRASVAWILVNRDGPRIQPGPRCYRRSWIRDGTLTGTALAEMGFAEEARAFLRWYAPYQREDGFVPCAVDRRGVDGVPEHDSHGQLAWGVVELFRLTGDRDFLRELWPNVRRAVDCLASLRARRTTEEFRGQPAFGLLPESISHEGYSSRPVHAYWDDFFALRGIADAAWAAAILGETEEAARMGRLRDELRADLLASFAATIAAHGIDFLPGSVELGDFDPTSMSIAFDPGTEADRLPAAERARTYERYWAEFEARRDGRGAEAYSGYEARNATALVWLGWKDRAFELLRWLVDDQRPTAWRQWPEVSTLDPRVPRFLGDLPHGWVASSFLRALRRLVVYERPDDDALVLAAGVPAAWVREAPGLRVRGLPTHAGLLDLEMYAETPVRLSVRLGGALRWPRAGVVLESPLPGPVRRVLVDGREQPVSEAHRVLLAEPASALILECEPG